MTGHSPDDTPVDSKTVDSHGTLYGIGVGPGDPDLITLKAARLIGECDVVSFIQNTQGESMARTIASVELSQRKAGSFVELPVTMTMSRDRTEINLAYDQAAERIKDYLNGGSSVGFLCEGDPLFFGSFAYVAQRLCDTCTIDVIPGVSSIMAGTALTGRALGLQTEKLAIISGRHSPEEISTALTQFDNVAIMKIGARRAQIKQLISRAGRTRDACYVEYIGLDNQRVVTDIDTLNDHAGPYFSLFLVNRERDGSHVTGQSSCTSMNHE